MIITKVGFFIIVVEKADDVRLTDWTKKSQVRNSFLITFIVIIYKSGFNFMI